jgi:hypothetical protein
MDLWAWVNETERRLRKEGHGRLADLIDRLPNEVCNDRHDRVDAIVPEALALAKSLDLAWIEVFLKHWWLQSRVLHRMDGRALGDAVALVDLAHRDETRACPQGVCAVQDLASCYGFVDGPGYAEERLAVAKETLDRIDASWPCFTCISSEYASALRDRGDVQQSLEFVDRQIATLIERGQRDALYDFPRDRIEVLIELGRLEEALAFVDEVARRGRKDAHHDLSRRLDRARILARMGRADDALQSLPTIDEVRPTPLFYWFWADAAEQLVRLGVAPNDAQLGRILQSFIDRLERQGVGRTTLELADLHGRLAVERGAPHVARRALAAMERAVKILAKPLDALDRVHKLRSAIAAAPGLDSIELPTTAEETLAHIRDGQGRDPERDLLFLEAARARFPSDAPLALALAGCELANGLEGEAIESLQSFHERENHDDIALRLGDLLIARDPERLRALVDRHRERAPNDLSRSIGDWLLARATFAARDWEGCRRHLDAVLRARPDAVNSRLLWADAARRSGDLIGALEKLDEVVARVPEGGPHDWERMVVATLLGDWARVRESALRVGFKLEGEGPIDEKWGVCRVRIDDEGRDAWAVRTGPVTARVVEVARPPRTQRFHDVVVFDATPLNPPVEGEEQPVFIYPWVATLHEGGYRAYEVDGVHPGDDRVETIRKAVAELDCELQVLSTAEYMVEHNGEELPGVFAVVALPRDRAPADVCRALSAAVGDHPLAFIELARDAENTELAQKHLQIVEDYNL